MTSQFDLFAAPPAPPAKPARSKRKAVEPLEQPPVVAADLPPMGAIARFDGYWHRWKKLGLCGRELGWERLKPLCHAAHASDAPPRLDRNGNIAEPYPRPASFEFQGRLLQIVWSEYGFSVSEGDRHLMHYSHAAANLAEALAFIRADEGRAALLGRFMEEPANEA